MLVKSSLFVALSVFAIFLPVAAQAGAICADKQRDIEQQISYANLHGNVEQAAGLQKALRESREHCTDEGLRADLQRHVQEKERKVADRQRELAEAQASGKSDKIAKQQHRLEEAQQDLREAREALR